MIRLLLALRDGLMGMHVVRHELLKFARTMRGGGVFFYPRREGIPVPGTWYQVEINNNVTATVSHVRYLPPLSAIGDIALA